jgi:hypothetical protein
MAAIACGVAATERAEAQTLIMPLGDSITEAETGHASYRYWLWHTLVDAGYEVDFVGSMTGVRNGPPLYPDFDQDHEGHWGIRADQVQAEIQNWATAAQPEIVLLHIGHNDLWAGQGVADAIADIEGIIMNLRAVIPEVVVLLAQVIPSNDSRLDEIPLLNAEIAILASALDTPESPVMAVDHWTGFDPVTDTYDGTHPNESGEQKMASRWAWAMGSYLELESTIFRDGFESGDTSAWLVGRK